MLNGKLACIALFAVASLLAVIYSSWLPGRPEMLEESVSDSTEIPPHRQRMTCWMQAKKQLTLGSKGDKMLGLKSMFSKVRCPSLSRSSFDRASL